MKTNRSFAVAMAMVCGLYLSARGQWVTNYLLKTHNNSAEYINSQLYDNGVNVGLNTTTPGAKFDVVGGNVRTTGAFVSLMPQGTAPLGVESSTTVLNLSSDYLDGMHASAFATATHTHAGMLSGAGSSGQVAFWSGGTMLSGNSQLYWDDGLERLGIGTTQPEAMVHLYGSSGSASLMLHETHAGLHGATTETRWNLRNLQGKLRFDWIEGGTTSTVLRLTGGGSGGMVEVGGTLKTSKLFVTNGATNNYLLSCTSTGMAVWKDPQVATGWGIMGDHVIKTNGWVFIGASNMGGKLNIATTAEPALMLQADPGPGAYAYGIWEKTNSNNLKAFALENNGVEKMIIWGDGKVQVDNIIKASEVEVKIDVWQDAVFDPDHPLMSLQELELYIQKNKHLPDIPSEAEVRENGLKLGNMESLLLKKIEELTLYVIELERMVKDRE